MNWSYYPYPPLPPPPPPLHYLPPSRPSSTPPYPSPVPPPPTPPPVTPPPTPEQYQQMWQHFNNFYAYYYQQPPAQYYYPPPPPYPSPSYSFSYPSDTEDGYSGYSSTEEMNGYFTNLQKQRQYQQMRGAQIESVENSETEYETDTEKPNDYHVKLYEDEEDTDYPMTTSMESAESVVGDYLSTIVEESEISDRKSQCSDCTLEKLSEDEKEESDEEEDDIHTDEEVVFVKLPLSVNRKDAVTTIIVGNSSKVSESKEIENEEKETEEDLPSSNLPKNNEEFSNFSNNNEKSEFNREYRETDNDISNDSNEEDDENTDTLNDIPSNNDSKEFQIFETYEEKKVKEKRIKNTETKISISYNGMKDEKIVNAVKKRTNKSTKSIYTSRLSGDSFDFDCWSESDVHQKEEVLDHVVTGRADKRESDDFKNPEMEMKFKKANLPTKETIVTEDLTTDENEPNVSVTVKFPLRTNHEKPKNGLKGFIQDRETFDLQENTENVSNTLEEKYLKMDSCELEISMKRLDECTTLDTSNHSSNISRCESPCDDDGSQSFSRSQDHSQSISETSEGNGKVCSFLENLSSILQNIKMSKSMEKDQILEGEESSTVTTIKNVHTTATVTSSYHTTSESEHALQNDQIFDSVDHVDMNKENIILESYSMESEANRTSHSESEFNKIGCSVESENNRNSDDDNASDEVDFWAEIGQPDEHMHLSMSKIEDFEQSATHVVDINETDHESDSQGVSNGEVIKEPQGTSMDCEASDNGEEVDESSESDSETGSDTSEDSSSSEDTSQTSSSCEEDEEEGRTFVFYHDSDDKDHAHYNDLTSSPPEIRIQANEEQVTYSLNDLDKSGDDHVFEQEDKAQIGVNVRSSVSSDQYKPYEMEDQVLQFKTENASNTLNVETRRSCQYESEEDDSGVTSDMSRHISETDTDHDQEFTELKKMSPYKRANTHSRLYQLLQDECELDKLDTTGDVSVPNKEKLSLPLGCHSIDNSNVSTPTSPIVSDKLVKELVQSLLNKKKGRIFRNLPVEKLHAAAIRILQEDVDYDTFSSTSGESSLLESPAEHSPSSTPLQRTVNRGSGAYSNYNDYYETWASASIQESLGSDIIPSRAFKILQEHVKPGVVPGFIEGLQAKCPKVSSATNLPSVMEVRDSLTPVPESNP